MILERLIVGIGQANCYIIGCKKLKEALVIDPGGDGEEIADIIERLELSVSMIINTHGHVDHIGANGYIKDMAGADLAIHESDAEKLKDPQLNLSAYFSSGQVITGPEASVLLTDGENISCGSLTIEVIHTPGHTEGGICLKVGGLLFTGDTLFAGSVGRTDLPGGSHEELINSINEKILVLEDDLLVYPGHGPSSTLDKEKKGNPYLA